MGRIQRDSAHNKVEVILYKYGYYFEMRNPNYYKFSCNKNVYFRP